MDRIIESVFKQVITIVNFCQKANIPYTVYAYSTGVSKLFHDKQSKQEFDKIMAIMLLTVIPGRYGRLQHDNELIRLSRIDVMDRRTTRTFDAMYNIYKDVKQLKVKHNIDIVNVMLFTDGVSHNSDFVDLESTDLAKNIYLDSKYTCMLTFDKKDKPVNLKGLYQHNIKKELLNTVFAEFKKLGNMIYVYCPTSKANASLDVHTSYFLSHYELHVKDSINITEKQRQTYRKSGVIDVGEYYDTVDSCIVINPKVFRTNSDYDTITSQSTFDKEKDSQIMKALKAKTDTVKNKKILLQLFGSSIASVL